LSYNILLDNSKTVVFIMGEVHKVL
jgi:hypothetical protein